MRLITAICTAATILACTPARAPIGADEGVTITETDAGARRTGDCARACDALSALDCPEARHTPAGTSCVDMCERLVASKVSNFRPRCTAEAGSVDAVRLCGVRCLR